MATRTTRQQILDAAQRLIEQDGFTRLTTKEIARESGFAEGTLFKHFKTKDDLCLAVVLENSPKFKDVVTQLRAGQASVQKNLEKVTLAALQFSQKLIPMAAVLLADVALLMRHREALRAGRGPRDAFDLVATYIADEQRLGRMPPDVEPLMISAILFGACFHRAFLRQAMGRNLLPMSDPEFARRLVATLTSSLGSHPRPRARAARGDSRTVARRSERETRD